MNIGLYAKGKGLGIIPKSPHVRTAAVLAVLSNLSFLRLHAKPHLRQNLCYRAMREDLAFAQLLQQRGAEGVCRLKQKIEYDQRDIEDLPE